MKPIDKAQRPGSRSRLNAFASNEGGATAIEYGLLVAGLALFIITAVTMAGTNISATLNKVSAALH